MKSLKNKIAEKIKTIYTKIKINFILKKEKLLETIMFLETEYNISTFTLLTIILVLILWIDFLTSYDDSLSHIPRYEYENLQIEVKKLNIAIDTQNDVIEKQQQYLDMLRTKLKQTDRYYRINLATVTIIGSITFVLGFTIAGFVILLSK